GTFGALYVSIPATPGGFVETETITSVQSGVELPYSHINENGFPGPEPEETRVFPVRTEAATSLFAWNGGFLEIYESCGSGSCPAGPYIAAHYIAATEVDPHPPTIATLSGTALAGGVLRGHQTLVAEAADVGGGLSNVTAYVNGVPAGAPVNGACAVARVSNRSTSGTVAYSPTPCPPKLKGEWTFDTSAYPFHDGSNSIQVCASDFATLGNPNTTCAPIQTVEVDNSCNESSVAGGEQLSAQFARSNSETQTVHFGREAEVVGTLENNAGEPVAGATLCVKMATLGTGAALADVGTVQTDSSGHYAYAVPAGPNREVMIGYRHDTAQIARSVRYYAHTKPILKAGPKKLKNGEKVRLWGSLPEPKAGGRVVVLQANVPGSHRWITFRKATTGERGRFKARYHFTSTTRRITYRFRALVPRQAGYPWDQGASKPTSVTVTR
ncbi:MAG TPA: hypothetical protein VHB53_11840, partial [Solirubrobacterales bacterium]|nr:hypothetical protein [Solirubrobacterales bacterium]